VIFVYDPAAEPMGLPCRLGSVAPCRASFGPPPPPEADGREPPPYRCRVYQEVAAKCPCQAGPDVSHDLRVTLLMTLEQANQRPDVFVLESDDGTVTQTRSAAGDARANDAGFAEVDFLHLPEAHSYRLRVEGIDEPYTVFDFTPFASLSSLGELPEALDVPVIPDFFVSDDAPEAAL
jgi:hypothetical protein